MYIIMKRILKVWNSSGKVYPFTSNENCLKLKKNFKLIKLYGIV